MYSSSDFPRIWDAIFSAIRDTGVLSSTALDFWFGKIRIVCIEGDFLVLSAENDIKQNGIMSKYGTLLSDAVKSVLGFTPQIDIIVEKPDTPLEGEGRVISPLQLAREMEAENARKEAEAAAAQTKRTPGSERKLTYNSEYTFDNFIVGGSNQFAHAAALAVANNPIATYNPLFIYGPSGLGKTHLMFAITNKLFEKFPDMNVIYVNCEDFTNQLIEAITTKGNTEYREKFREKYRKADMLLIDDIQFIAGKESTQEEFFHTFNALYQEKKQIILTSDRPPKDMVTLEERIRSRFEQGVLADIQLPDYELRLAILKNKAESMNLTVSDEILSYIAEKLQSNIRQLEGIIKRISANHLLNGARIDMDLVRSLVPMFQQDNEPVGETAEKVVAAVAKRYNVTPDDIMGTKRTKDIKDARNLSMYVIKEVTGITLSALGTMFQRDHSTIHSNISTVEKQVKTDAALRAEIADIRREIKK